MAIDERRPTTIEEALRDCLDAMADPEHVAVVPTNALMVEMLTLLLKVKHA